MKDLDNISQRDLDIMKSLVNPDDAREKKYRWDLRYQQEVLGMLLMDKVFLIQSMQLIRPEYFVDKAHEVICDILFRYFSRYNQLPAKFVIANEIRERYPDNDKRVLIYTGELEALTASYIPGLESRDACLDKITEFAKEMALRAAVSRTLDLLESTDRERWTKIEDLFKKALLTDRNFDIGLDYFQTLDERYERMIAQMERKEVFTSGFDQIDRGLTAGGICRGELAAYMGVSGAGKSLMLVKAAVQNLVNAYEVEATGKKILYVSLEMSEDKLAKRFDSMVSQVDINSLIDKKDIVKNAIREQIRGEDDKRKLIIKQFPAGTADVNTIRAYMAQTALYGWSPDLVIVDYVGELKDYEGIKTYESRQRLVRDLRALAVEHNVAVFTALQANRRGKEEQQDDSPIDDSMLADSYGQSRVCDAIWSINQSPAEKEMGLARIYIAKHRDGNSRYLCYVKQDRQTLMYSDITKETYNIERSKFSVKKSSELEIDKVIGKKRFKQNDE